MAMKKIESNPRDKENKAISLSKGCLTTDKSCESFPQEKTMEKTKKLSCLHYPHCDF